MQMKVSRAVAIFSRISVAIFVISPLHCDPGLAVEEIKTMDAVALLFHGKYGEQPYKLSTTADGGLALEEIGPRSFRFVCAKWVRSRVSFGLCAKTTAA
jgi:hypothetical protein